LCLVLAACQASNPLALPTETPPPPTPTPQATASPTPLPGSPTGFDDLLAQAQTMRPDQRQDLVNRYVGQLVQTPVAGDDEAIFLFRGAAQAVQILGDMNDWDIEQAPAMTRLEGTDLWYWRANFEPDARLDYQLLVDGRPIDLDPLNPNTVPSPGGPKSELRMPAYQTPAEVAAPTERIPSGAVTSHTLDSQHLGQRRTFLIYEPPGQIVGQALPSLYVNGGTDYLNLIDTPAILDRLIAQRQIPPLLTVFIAPINAEQEYALNDAYADFLADELVPYVQERYGANTDPAATGIMGNALGGLAAIHTAVNHSDVFGLVAAQSGRFGRDMDALIRDVGRQRARPAEFGPPRVYLVAGAYETAVEAGNGPENVLEANRQMAAVIEQAGFDYRLDERPEGHSWGLWRGSLGRALSYLFNPGS
jgi:enterochelin esterase family protein